MYLVLILIIFLQLPTKGGATEILQSTPANSDAHHIDYAGIGPTLKGVARENLQYPMVTGSETFSQDQRFGRDVEKGTRKDCRTAYAGLSLFAIPFLLFDTLSKTGCKW